MHDGDRIIVSVQYWPVALVEAVNRRHDLRLLGRVGVAPLAVGRGIGIALIRHSLGIADWLECGALVLIGDVEYYGRFGFAATETKN